MIFKTFPYLPIPRIPFIVLVPLLFPTLFPLFLRLLAGKDNETSSCSSMSPLFFHRKRRRGKDPSHSTKSRERRASATVMVPLTVRPVAVLSVVVVLSVAVVGVLAVVVVLAVVGVLAVVVVLIVAGSLYLVVVVVVGGCGA